MARSHHVDVIATGKYPLNHLFYLHISQIQAYFLHSFQYFMEMQSLTLVHVFKVGMFSHQKLSETKSKDKNRDGIISCKLVFQFPS